MDSHYLVLIVVAAVSLSAAIGLLLGRYAWPSLPIDPAGLAALQSDLVQREQECGTLRSQVELLGTERTRIESESREFSRQCAGLDARVTSLQQQIEHQSSLLRNAEIARVEAQERANRDAGEIARLIEREKTLAEKVEAQVVEVHQLNEKLTSQFENIATRVLKANANQLTETSNQSLSALLGPLQQKIGEFQKKVEDTYSSERSEVISLKEQIKLALDVSQNVGQKADDLAKALRGKSQQLGSWGELILERILEEAGLKEGREYITQGRGLQLKSDEGGAIRPDVIVNLTQGRTLIVDSKVPLAAYERLVMTEDANERDACRGQFLRDVRGHIEDLAGKRYQENSKLQAHEFAMLFMPVESSLYEALNGDPGLFTYAWNRNVVLVGPSTLLATMRTVASIWRHEKQAENAQRIARDAGLLLDKLSNSMEDFKRVGSKLSEASDAHNEALKKLFNGKGNAVSIGQRIRDAGVKAKPIPSLPVEGVDLAAANSVETDTDVERDMLEDMNADSEDSFADSLLDGRH